MGREFTIAITGHRPNRMHVGVPHIVRQIRRTLRPMVLAGRSLAVPMRPVAISALAEGSDRLFAVAALELSMPLRVLLPFPVAAYETTFGDAATTPHFRSLLASAASVRELPGSLENSQAGYEAVGRACVDECDVLLAVWDGKPAAGRGGTPEIIDYALSAAKPVLWIDAAERRDVSLLLANGATKVTRPASMATLRCLVLEASGRWPRSAVNRR